MKVGVIGTGAMGKNHARMYASLTEYCQFVGVYDSDYRRACSVADEHGGIAFRSLQDLLGQVDAVSVVVPTPSHYEIGLRCVSEKVHLLMEKPITETVQQAKKLIEKARMNQVVLQVGHIELFNPTVQVLKELLGQEEIVAIEMSRLRPKDVRMSSVDVISDAMIHDVYILYHLLGNQVRNIYALGKQKNLYTEHATALLNLQSGAFVQLTASYLSHEKVRTIRAISKDSILMADLLNHRIQKYGLQHPNHTESISVPYQDPLRMELMDFIKSVNSNQTPKVTGGDGLAALSLVNKIIRKVSSS